MANEPVTKEELINILGSALEANNIKLRELTKKDTFEILGNFNDVIMERFDTMDNKLDSMDIRLNNVESSLQNFKEDTNKHFEEIDEKLDSVLLDIPPQIENHEGRIITMEKKLTLA